jgi:hypothetical protein
MTILKNPSNSKDPIDWNRGEIKENWKFNGQLRVKLHKSKTKDQNKKDAEIQGLYWSVTWAKLHKNRSLGLIRGAIKRN